LPASDLTDRPHATHLARVREDFSAPTIGAALASPFRAVRAAAVDVLGQRLGERDYQDAVVRLFQQADPPGPETLFALSLVHEVHALPIAGDVAELLQSSAAPLRKNAARLLARCFPERCPQHVLSLSHFDVRYEFCFSQDDGTAVALYRWYLANDRDPDPAFGLLLTPEWMARHAEEFPETIARLAVQCGYTSGQPIEEVRGLLEAGFWCVPERTATADQLALASRSAELERMMSQLLTGARAPEAIALDLATPIDFAALCGPWITNCSPGGGSRIRSGMIALKASVPRCASTRR